MPKTEDYFDTFTIDDQTYYVEKVDVVTGLKFALEVMALSRENNCDTFMDLIGVKDTEKLMKVMNKAFGYTLVDNKKLSDQVVFEDHFKDRKKNVIIVGVMAIAKIVTPFV